MWYQGKEEVFYVDPENKVWRAYDDGHVVLIPLYHSRVRDYCKRIIIPTWAFECVRNVENIERVAMREFMKEEAYVDSWS